MKKEVPIRLINFFSSEVNTKINLVFILHIRELLHKW